MKTELQTEVNIIIYNTVWWCSSSWVSVVRSFKSYCLRKWNRHHILFSPAAFKSSSHRTFSSQTCMLSGELDRTCPSLLALLFSRPVWHFMLHCHLLSSSPSVPLCSSAAHWTQAEFSAATTEGRTWHKAPQCPLSVGLCHWWWQAKNPKAALGPSGYSLSRTHGCPPLTLFSQTEWADAA